MQKMSVTQAVRELRLHLGETQQSMAGRLGIAISTMVRHETNRPPRGGALIVFMNLADENRRPDLADVFQKAISEELGYKVRRFSQQQNTVEVQPSEREPVEALLDLLRFPGYEEDLAIIRPVIDRIIIRRRQNKATLLADVGLYEEVQRRISVGESDEQIVANLPAWSPQIVTEMAASLRVKTPEKK